MTVRLLRNYSTFLSGATVTLTDSTESALIAQGLAVSVATTSFPSNIGSPDAYLTQGGNLYDAPQSGIATPAVPQGPNTLPCIGMGGVALTTFETNGVAGTAGSIYFTEIFVPHLATWTGVGVLNGTVVGTDNFIVAVYSTNGTLMANSALAGTLSAGASVFQNIPFTTPVQLVPGRYFIAFQSNGTTATIRHLLAANGVSNYTGSQAGVFGTIPATITVPTSFTTAVGVITQLYV